MIWEPLPDRDWGPTIRSLHRWSQIVGKIRLKLASPMNHWWHVPFYVSARGLTTSAMPYLNGFIELEFDLSLHRLTLDTSKGPRMTIRLRAMPVCEFYADVCDLLSETGIDVRAPPSPG